MENKALTVLRQLASDYNKLKLRDIDDSYALQMVVATVPQSPLVLANAQAATEFVAQLSRLSGWCRYRSGLELFPHDRSRPDSEFGPPLAGEWIKDPDSSIHLRPSAENPGAFVAWTYQERMLVDGECLKSDDETAMLRQRIAVLARPETEDDNSALTSPKRHDRQRVAIYHVFWAGTEADPYEIGRRFARFAGFDQEIRAIWNPKQDD